MCTDYEIWYACGHKAHPARPDLSKLNEQEKAAYANSDPLSPTARVYKHCPLFKSSGKICQIQDRLVVTQRWDIVCFDDASCKPVEKFDDSECPLLQKSLEASAVAGQNQPPVWGRKGPHVKKPRKVKTKEERERDREEKERVKAQKEAEKAEKKDLAAARALTDLASGKPAGGRKKAAKAVDLQETAEKRPVRSTKRKADIIEFDQRLEPTKRKKLAPTTASKPETKAKPEPKKNTQPKGKRKAAGTADPPSKPAPKKQRKEKTG
ncbi:hypothetical protein TWF481_011931 [Arthrobotrys musiformis]|uniref:Uncharacterized protein n=1 Tax=Arthrobotrys musiformis TaxID=47236 RepID=A0AAV9VVK0_9PEZI